MTNCSQKPDIEEDDSDSDKDIAREYKPKEDDDMDGDKYKYDKRSVDRFEEEMPDGDPSKDFNMMEKEPMEVYDISNNED